MVGSFKVFGFSLLFLVCVSVSAVSADASTKKKVSNTRYIRTAVRAQDSAIYRRFDTAFAWLSEHGKVTFAAEGTPLQPELTGEQAAVLEKDLEALPKDKQGRILDFDDFVGVIARAYDYDAQHLTKGKRKIPNVFTLTKRYSDPEDLPFITLEEAELSLRNIRRAVEKLVSPDVLKTDRASTLTDLYRSLTPEQQATANQDSAVGGILVGDLNDRQRKLAGTFFANFHFAPLQMFHRLEARLHRYQNKDTAFCRFDHLGVNVFGISGPPVPPEDSPLSVPLSHGFFTQAGGAITIRVPRNEVDYRDGKFHREPPDRDAPDPSAPVRPLTLPLACSMTLGKLIEQLAKSSNDKTPLVGVEPALAAKPVSLFGADRADTRTLLDAVAAVYGLHVQPFVQREPQGERQGYRITLPIPRVLEDFSELPAEIRRLLPSAVTRIPVGGSEGALKAIAGSLPRTIESPASSIRETQQKQRGRIGAFQRTYAAALRRLRALMEPKIPKGSDTRIPIMESGEEAKCLVAVMALSTLGEFADQMTENVIPTYITDSNNVALSIHWKEKDGQLEIGFGIKHRDKTSWVVGSMSAPLKSPK